MHKQHLTLLQRYTICRMYQAKKRQSEIAYTVGCSQSTISKELSRHRNSHGHYVPSDAQMFADESKERFKRTRKFTEEIRRTIEEHIRKHQWSAEQIKNVYGSKMVSIERIYQYIRADKASGGNLYRYCRHKLKHRKRSLYQKAGIAHIPDRVSIRDRPPIVDTREDFGHWEMDLIQNGKDFVLTVVERKTRFMMMEKLINGKNAKEVSKTLCKLLIPYKKDVHTITTDNGSEFAKHKIISKKLNTKIYFTDPYYSWQKGSIENINKLIRQYIPKNANIKNLTYNQLLIIQNKINYRPKKLLNFNKPALLFYSFVS